jgi:hypothetical protein
MAEKGKKSVTQKDVDGFVQYILTPQSDLNAIRRSGGFFKKGDENPDNNPLINYYLKKAAQVQPFSLRKMLLNEKKFRDDITPLQIKTISEALYFAANNPLISVDPLANPSVLPGNTDISRKYIAPMYSSDSVADSDISSIYELYKAGDITRSEASSRISNILSQTAANDIPEQVFLDTTGIIKYRAEDEGFMTSGVRDAFDERKDLSRILSTINPEISGPVTESFYAGPQKAREAMQILAAFGYDRQRTADAIGIDVGLLDDILGGMIGYEEYYKSPELKEVPTQLVEAGEDIPGFSYYGVPTEGALGYISPEGVRDDTISILSNEELRRQAAQGLGTGLDPAGKVIYQREVFGEPDYSRYTYGYSPKFLEIISQNPDYSLQDLTAANYGMGVN